MWSNTIIQSIQNSPHASLCIIFPGLELVLKLLTIVEKILCGKILHSSTDKDGPITTGSQISQSLYYG